LVGLFFCLIFASLIKTNSMKLELKNIKVNLTFSEETTMFQADIFANGKKIGYANNDGHGGCTWYNRYPNQEEAMKAAEAYVQTLPSDFYEFRGEKHEIKMNLEHWIDKQIDAYVTAKETAKFEKKMETHIIIKRTNGNYSEIGYGTKVKIKDLSHDNFVRLVNAAKASLKEGDVVLNKNI
jgi:hypothetical protein